MNGKKTAFLGLMLTLSLILSYVESLIILPAVIPGIRIGLANLAVVFLIYRYGAKEGLLVNVLRILLSALLFGNAFGLFYSLAGGLLSFFCMILVKKLPLSSVPLVSLTGGITHNWGQLAAAAILFSPETAIYLFPLLTLTGLLCGTLNGFIAAVLLKYIKKEQLCSDT
ncbi:MAG: Gx transporter family protein [Lachnospiraceae bacterium]|nr:Gx transporter family protein [Lachnospiraceae bacterium]